MSETTRYAAGIVRAAVAAGLVGTDLAERLSRRLVTIKLSADSAILADKIARLFGVSRETVVLIALSRALSLGLPPGAQSPAASVRVTVEPARNLSEQLLPLSQTAITAAVVAGLYWLDSL